MEKISFTTEYEEKSKYLDAFLQQQQHFSPFFVSVDGLIGNKAEYTLKRLTSLLAIKWRQTYAMTCSYVLIGVTIKTVRAAHLCILVS